MPPFLQRCSQDSSFGRGFSVLLTPAQQYYRVSGQVHSDVFKCRTWVVFWVPGDLIKVGWGKWLAVDLSQQVRRHKVCIMRWNAIVGDVQAWEREVWCGIMWAQTLCKQNKIYCFPCEFHFFTPFMYPLVTFASLISRFCEASHCVCILWAGT